MDETLKAALAAWVEEHRPGARLGKAWPLTGGVSARMIAFEAVRPDEVSRFILRQPNAHSGGGNPAAARREHRLLAWLDDSGAAVQEVHGLDVFGARFGAPSLILEYVEGEPDFAPADPILFAQCMAAALTHVHWHGQAGNGLDFLPEITGPARAHLDGLGDRLHAGSDEARWLAALDGRFPPPELNEPTLLHGDFWPGNVIWHGFSSTIIDWEEAAWGDPLADLAISRLDLLWMLGPEAMEAFTAHYVKLNEVDITHLPEWDLSAALRPYGALETWAAAWPDHGRPVITAATMAAGLTWFAAQALARLT